MNGEIDTSQNHYLAAALHAAKSNQMPKTTIEAAIKRATAKKAGGGEEQMKPVIFQGMHSLSGCAVIVETLTNNSARTNAEVRLIFKKNEAAISKVDYMFAKGGRVIVGPGKNEKTMEDLELYLMDLEDAEIDDVQAGPENNTLEIRCSAVSAYKLQKDLDEAGLHIYDWTQGYLPIETVQISYQETGEAFQKFIDALENHDDVVQVFTNAA